MAVYRRSISIIFLILALETHLKDCAKYSKEQELLQFLLKDYNIEARPTLNPTTRTNVTFSVEIVQLVSVNDRKQRITTSVWVRQTWINELLTWNTKDFQNIDRIRVDPRMIWIPDIVLYNSADSEFSGGLEKYKTRVIIASDGKCSWYCPVSFTSTCSIDITNFPFDQQKCILKFGSWTFSDKDMDLLIDDTPSFSTFYLKSAEWDLIDVRKYRRKVYYPCCPDPFVYVTIEMTIRRKPLFYVFNLIIPCCIILTMMLLDFLLPPESGERITLSITVLLAMAVFLQLVSENLPRNSESIPLLGSFYVIIMGEISVSLLATCWVLNIHYRSSGTSIKVPMWIKLIIVEWLGSVLCMRRTHYHPKTRSRSYRDEESSLTAKLFHRKAGRSPSPESEYPAYELHHLRNNHESSGNISNRSTDNNKYLNNGSKTNSNRCCAKCGESVEDRVVNDIHILASNVKYRATLEKNQEEWKQVAMVLDRLFFLLFVLTILTSTMAIFYRIIKPGGMYVDPPPQGNG